MGFQCQQFYLKDDRCAMKVSTDSLLLGAWVNIGTAKRLADFGCGCGILALMLAQRSTADAEITAIERDQAAAEQATENVAASPWPTKVQVLQQDIRDRLDALVERTEGYGWHEDLMRIYIVFGLLEDCQLRVAKGLAAARRVRVEAMLSDNSLMDFCEQALSRSIADNPSLAHDLALFGRAIVADALLEVRDMVSFEALKLPNSKDEVALTREQFKLLEPLTSELISQHTLRMDALGLTA